MDRAGSDRRHQGRLGWGRLALFALPMLVVQAIEIPWRTYLPAMFSERLGVPLAAIGTLLLAVRLFDMLFDPFVGWASDRLPTRWGLRRPWMVASLPLILIGGGNIFFAAPGIGLPALAGWCLVLHAGYTMLVTPHGGWTLELGDSAHDRTRAIVARTWIAAAATPLIILLPTILERGFGASRDGQIAAMGGLLLLLAPLAVLIVVRGFAEPVADRAAVRRSIDPVRQFAAMLRDADLRPIVLLYAFAGLAEATSSGTFLFFVEQAIGFPGWASALLLGQGLVVLVALPVWGWIGRRIDKRRALTGVYAWQAGSMALAFLLPRGALGPMIAFLIVRGLVWGADFLLLRAMVADASARDAAQGLRRAGSYYALFNVTLKLAMSVGAGAALWLLAMAGFVPGHPATSDALAMVRLVYALPACLSGAAGMLIVAMGAHRPRFRLAPSGPRPTRTALPSG